MNNNYTPTKMSDQEIDTTINAIKALLPSITPEFKAIMQDKLRILTNERMDRRSN